MNLLVVLVVAIVLVMAAGALAMLESALGEVSPARATELNRDGVRGAETLHAVASDAPRHVGTLLLLRLACELTATTIVAVEVVAVWGIGWPAVFVTAGGMTLVSFVLVGVGPRTMGRQHAYPVALRTAAGVRWLGRLLGPPARLLIKLGNAVTPGQGIPDGPFAAEVELRELVDLAEQRGVVEQGERRMIESVVELGDTIAREVMVPRTELVWIEQSKIAKQALALALRSGFSRIPVIGENLDDIVGVVYLKDLVRRTQGLRDGDSGPRVDEVMRAPEFVPESKPVDALLREMQARRIHIAIVIDEYGGTAGLVTIEDILEEIVGEITDEYDVERPPVQHLTDGTVRVTARLPVEDLGDLFDVRLPTDEVETVGGLLAQALGRVPIPGATAEVEGLVLVAESAGGRRNRIDTVSVRRVSSSGEDADGTEKPSTEEAQTADV